jgi:hypothetical protein
MSVWLPRRYINARGTEQALTIRFWKGDEPAYDQRRVWSGRSRDEFGGSLFDLIGNDLS